MLLGSAWKMLLVNTQLTVRFFRRWLLMKIRLEFADNELLANKNKPKLYTLCAKPNT